MLWSLANIFLHYKFTITSEQREAVNVQRLNIKGVHRNKSRGGGNLNCKFKTFGFLDSLIFFISPSNKTSRNFLGGLRGTAPPPVYALALYVSCFSCFKDWIVEIKHWNIKSFSLYWYRYDDVCTYSDNQKIWKRRTTFRIKL